eukprot:2461482-Rhodomonas_salina.8
MPYTATPGRVPGSVGARQVVSAIGLRQRYAMSSTDAAYVRPRRDNSDLWRYHLTPSVLRARYVLPGRGIGYAATLHVRHAMSSTDIGYAATRPGWTTRYPIGLRAPYAMSGTGLLYAATNICLRAPYAMSGTDSADGTSR